MIKYKSSITVSLSAFIFLLIFMQKVVCDEIIPNTLIIKFKENTKQFTDWKSESRMGIIPDVYQILGNISTKPYISDACLQSVEKRIDFLNRKNNTLLSSYDKSKSISSIERICIIKYDKNIDPILAAQKLSSLNYIEYAEPMYERHIVANPNDPDISLQYYLDQVHAIEAWNYVDTTVNVVVGIIDTGVDYLHPDLAANIWTNPGETGLDSLGRDKSTNGIDDDGNGFIDDWHGWDFVSSQNPTIGDNDPMPGHEHGTHVGGTIGAVVNNGIGIAGVAGRVKIMPVKCGNDDPYSTSVGNTYEAILYAASNGADILNCSWGGTNKSQAEQDIIDQVVKLGSLIVAAAGNDNVDAGFYPASYKGVMSVAAVNQTDIKAYFSNYNRNVGVSAPGVGIYATIPNNNYTYMDGTSMASPVAAGVAAIVKQKYPNYTPLQLMEQVKATADNIDAKNNYYKGKLGRGRVNALNAVTTAARSIVLNNYSITDASNDGVLDPGEEVRLNISLINILSPLINSTVEVKTVTTPYKFNFTVKDANLGNMITNEIKSCDREIVFTVPTNVPPNYALDFEIRVSDSTGYINSIFITLTFSPTYRTMKGNDVWLTFNSIGNLAYNDYPSNIQGEGMKYKGSQSFLFEGAFMAAISENRISDVARASSQYSQDRSFFNDKLFLLSTPGSIASEEGFADFTDNKDTTVDVGCEVIQHAFQFDSNGMKNFIIISYDVINKTASKFDSLYTALFFDWDLGPSGSNNQVLFDFQKGFGYAYRQGDTTVPLAGAMLLSNQKLNFFAIDNDGSGIPNPGIYDGFTNQEKWFTMTNGIGREVSSLGDASMVIGGGPVSLNSGDTVRFVYSLFAGNSLQELDDAAKASRAVALETGIADGKYTPPPTNDDIVLIYPRDNQDFTIQMNISMTEYVSMDISDYTGRQYATIYDKQLFTPGSYNIPVPFNMESMYSGFYFVRINTLKTKKAVPFVIVH